MQMQPNANLQKCIAFYSTSSHVYVVMESIKFNTQKMNAKYYDDHEYLMPDKLVIEMETLR